MKEKIQELLNVEANVFWREFRRLMVSGEVSDQLFEQMRGIYVSSKSVDDGKAQLRGMLKGME